MLEQETEEASSSGKNRQVCQWLDQVAVRTL